MCKHWKFKIEKKKKGVFLISKHADAHKRKQIPHTLYPERKKCESNPKNLYLIQKYDFYINIPLVIMEKTLNKII